MANYDIAYDRTDGHEGGWANNPKDKGGETYRGIARKFNPGWAGWGVVDRAKKPGQTVAQLNAILAADSDLQASVKSFFKAYYWDPLKLDQIKSQALANDLYDISVNMYWTRAATFLQRAINMASNDQRLYPFIAVDTIVGPKTLDRANNNKRPAYLRNLVNGCRAAFHIAKMEKETDQQVFGNSWFSRFTIGDAA